MRAILTYHSIDASGSPVSLARDTFRAHVQFLSQGPVRVVPLADLVGAPDTGDAVALTFDDAFDNFRTEALPHLADHGLPATVFVVTEHAGRTNQWSGDASEGIPVLPLMTWDALGRAAELGVEIGAHSRRHRDLTALPPSELEDEVRGSGERIAQELGVRPTSFAYPYGKHDLRSEAIAREVFQRACTTELRDLTNHEGSMRLPRLDAYYFSGPAQLEAWGTSGFRRRLWLRAQGRKVRQLATLVALGGRGR